MKNKVFHTRLIILLAVIATTIFVTGCNCKSCKKMMIKHITTMK